MSALTIPALEQTYAHAVPALSVPWQAVPIADPRLLVLNEELARELGLDPEALRADPGLLVGRLPDGAQAYAQAYAGHQFGSYSPRLGDGRALLVGELGLPDGGRVDLHLKGSGRTPFARGGDGKAVVGPMLREYLMGEAMHALGIPTTRALSVVATGEPVLREGAQPGAVLCRVASSHLRVGTFQYAAATGDRELLHALADYAIARHYPRAAEAPGPGGPYRALLAAVVAAQADLVSRWMLVGFIHGVMNTDNMTISGETIDYGPCAMMDRFDLGTVFSSIDHGGRYAYGNQPAIALWNLSRFAETLIPLLDDDTDTAISAAMGLLEGFGPLFQAATTRGMAVKLGLITGAEPGAGEVGAKEEAAQDPLDAAVTALVADLQTLLSAHRVDFTGFFRALAAGTARRLFEEPAAFDAWAERRDGLLPDDRGAVVAAMTAVNPAYIPRNHRVEEALAAATAGDLAPYLRLLDAVRRPYDERAGLEDLLDPAPADAWPHVTYCGT